MTNHPNRSRYERWLNSLDGLCLSDPLRRAAQIALAAIDEIITKDALADGADNTGITVAYEQLCAALAETADEDQPNARIEDR